MTDTAPAPTRGRTKTPRCSACGLPLHVNGLHKRNQATECPEILDVVALRVGWAVEDAELTQGSGSFGRPNLIVSIPGFAGAIGCVYPQDRGDDLHATFYVDGATEPAWDVSISAKVPAKVVAAMMVAAFS